MSNVPFKPAWWLPGPHAQTLWAALCRRKSKPSLKTLRERIELLDGDFIDLEWAGGSVGPIVLILHGLEGSAESPYAQGLLKTFTQQHWRSVVMHFRGCSGETNRLSRTYHSGETSDIAAIVKILQAREPLVPIMAVGFSLGANVLLKWLGETGAENPLMAAVAVSTPFELEKTVRRLQQGLSRVYDWHLLRCLNKKMVKKFKSKSSPIDIALLGRARSLYDFDDQVTAPLHGFSSAHDYYTRSSCRQFIKGIQIPTLLLQAKDDPFMAEGIIPQAHELPSSVTLEVTEQGGHVGFVMGQYPWRPEYWLEQRIPAFLRSVIGL